MSPIKLHQKKREFRIKARKNRDTIPQQIIREKSAAIFGRLKSTKLFRNAKTVFVYMSFASEVDTKEVIAYCHTKGKTVLLPKIEGGHMFAVPYQPSDPLYQNAFGVLEPATYTAIDQVDLVLCPGIAFDKRGRRMGYGKGYYDKWLQKAKCSTIGLCFDEQLYDEIPASEYDQKMEVVVTDTRVIHCDSL